MLSIAAMRGSGAYYLELASEDYYLRGGEPLGRWWGRGAEQITGLGNVAKDDLKALLKGFSAAGKPLIQNAGKENRQQGWDLTFSAPKSVSVLWSQADQETRAQIQGAHFEAVKAALDCLQDEWVMTRRGKGGEILEKADLIAALFEHGTSREMDPQLHTHALLLNLCLREDGTSGTILSKPFYEVKLAIGAIYRAELAKQLSDRLGVVCELAKTGTSFVVVGVLQKLCDEFSKRRDSIVEVLTSRGNSSAAAAAAATLESRRKKTDIPPRSELTAGWRKVAEAFGFNFEKVLNQSPRFQNPQKAFQMALAKAFEELTDSDSHFTRGQLLHRVAVNAQGQGLSAAAIRKGLEDLIKKGEQIVSLGELDGRKRYTTPEVMKLEKELIKLGDRLHGDGNHGAAAGDVENAIKKFSQPRSTTLAELKHHAEQLLNAARKRETSALDRKSLKSDAAFSLNDEQKMAVRHLTGETEGSIRVLEGWAGTGKTSALRVAREIWEKDGYQVMGIAVAGKASKELTKGAGIQSDTFAMFERRTQHNSLADVLGNEARQLGRALAGKGRYDRKPLRLDAKTVLVVDEASMCSTRQLHVILSQAKKAGALVVLIGDRSQLSAIQAGGAFAYFADRYGKAELTSIVRQRDEWMRETVREFRRGDAAAALKRYEEAGRLHVSENRDEAMKAMVRDWAKNERGREKESLIFVGTRSEAHEVNKQCQRTRIEAGDIRKTDRVTVTAEGVLDSKSNAKTSFDIYNRDRVLFTQRSRSLGIENGDTGTVIGISKRPWPASSLVTVEIDSGDTVSVPLKKYEGLRLGYAMTTHKGQGTTIERAYILAGGQMTDRAMSYVQASRARDAAHIYTDKFEVGDKLSRLAKQMSEDRDKTMAHSVLEQPKQEPKTEQNISIQQERRL